MLIVSAMSWSLASPPTFMLTVDEPHVGVGVARHVVVGGVAAWSTPRVGICALHHAVPPPQSRECLIRGCGATICHWFLDSLSCARSLARGM